MLYLNYIDKLAEVDDWEKGCLPETTFNVDIDWNTKKYPNAIEALRDFFGSFDMGGVLVNLDGMTVQYSRTETAESIEASKQDIEDWKVGRLKLWYANYTFSFDKVEISEPEFKDLGFNEDEINIG